MNKSKTNFIRITATMAIFLFAYFVSSMLKSDFWGNILSPINAFTAAGVLLFSYLKSNRTVKASVTFMLYAFACAAWGVADIMWVVISFSGGSPEHNPAIWIIYFIPNCLLLSSMVVFGVNQFRKWDIVQFTIDLIINTLIIMVMFWIVFLQKDISVLRAFIESDFTSLLSIGTDVAICILIFTCFLSVRGGKIPAFSIIISLGMVIFAWTDLLYYYLFYANLYFPNTMIDFIYILSLSMIAFGGLWKTYKSNELFDLSTITNIGRKGRWFLLLLFPFVTVFLMVTGVGYVHVNSIDLLTFALLILIYWACCKYVQLSLEKESILKNQNEILEQRVAEQLTELTFLVNQDTLTALYNRRYFMDCLDKTIMNKQANDIVALLLIDMDRFKIINDTFGHDVGDRVLIDISDRLIAWNNYGATISRLGGDEFAIMFAGKYTQKDIEDYCKEIIDLFSKPLRIEKITLNLTTSIGIAIITSDERDSKSIMQDADIAMYRAKAQGYNRYLFFDAFMSRDIKESFEIESLLRQTDAESDFELYFQPQFALPNKNLIGAEALIRWNQIDHGFIPPNVFIHIAEQINYIFKIGEWVMQKTVRQAKIWNMQYNLPLKIGFNISPKQFQDKNFMNFIRTLLLDEDLDPSFIDAEITESMIMGSEESLSEVFSIFQELGITVSIDDFGSGFSGLGNLNKFPFNRIKIDKSLIDNISYKNTNGMNVVKAAIHMAHASGLKIIAEGVETEEQLEILTELDCDQIQGYILGRPVPAHVFEDRYIKTNLQDPVQSF